MKIKKFIEFSDEIDVDVSVDDIATAFIFEKFEPETFLNTMNAVATFLNAVPDYYIKENLVASQRETIRSYLLKQVERFE